MQSQKEKGMIKFDPKLDDFDSKNYAVSEINEPVIRTIGYSVITRCRYGAEVINMPSIMAIDIDYMIETKGKEETMKNTVELAKKIVEDYDLAFRIYRTFKGLRVIVLGEDFHPRTYKSYDLMCDFDCDDIYSILCIKQNCFRLRLTPKPERIGITDKYDSSQSWIDRYNQAIIGFASAKFIQQIGPDIDLPDEIKIHDNVTGSFTSMPLA
jgi:hypothetical protein